jgi:uncharacterized protein (DUF111 family)
MLVALAKSFVTTYPSMVPEIVGYGAGRRKLTNAPNFLRLVIGHSAEKTASSNKVQILETNLDDVPGEIVAHALQRLLDSGAKDAWLTSAQFKKNRPGHVLHVICDLHDAERIAEIMMQETGTLGVRYQVWDRFTLQRDVKTIKVEIATRTFDVKVKFARDMAGKIVRVKPEFDDIHAIAQALSMPAREVSGIVLREALRVAERKIG